MSRTPLVIPIREVVVGRRAGFTLVEVLVASLLMGMLVTILTMVFNQSSIAWRTGKASVAEIDDMRRYYSQVQRHADNALPGVQGKIVGRIGDAWGGNGTLQKRALRKWDLGIKPEDPTEPGKKSCVSCSAQGFMTGKISSYTVGVWSYGPDGKDNTGDDISTWPADGE